MRLAVPLLEVVEDLPDTEQAHRHDDEVDAVGQLQAVEGEPGGAAEVVAADGGQQQTDGSGDHCLELVPAADGGHQQDAKQRQGGVLRWSEVQGDAGDDRGQQREPDDRDGRAHKRADRRDTQGRSRFALFGQREAVEDGDHRGGLPGQAQQHRGDGAAVLGAVVDAGEHDDR